MGQILHGSRDDARRQSSDTAIAGFDRGTEQELRPQSKDGREVEEARDRRGRTDGTEGAPLIRSKQGGRGARRGVPPAHAPAARRLPLCAPGDDPAPHPVFPSTLSPAPWHQPAAGGGGHEAENRLQGLSYWVLPHRYRRSLHRGGASTLLCPTAETRIFRRCVRFAAPSKLRLLASVAPLAKTISPDAATMSAATAARASSTASAASQPSACSECGLPNRS
jgi:hypothetical protein